MATSIAESLQRIRQRIDAAARRARRDPDSVTLVGVSKTVPVDRVREAFAAGLRDLGENKVQEARDKVPLLPEARWHLVGHLQSNKAAHAARLFQMVHSIDSPEILVRLDQAAAKEGRTIDCLVEVDLAGEATKHGLGPERLDGLLERAVDCRHALVRGLMVLPPYDPDAAKARPYFRRLRGLLEEARARHGRLELREMSMGMTEDFEVAIEEGATLVRVGRAIFGERAGGAAPRADGE